MGADLRKADALGVGTGCGTTRIGQSPKNCRSLQRTVAARHQKASPHPQISHYVGVIMVDPNSIIVASGVGSLGGLGTLLSSLLSPVFSILSLVGGLLLGPNGILTGLLGGLLSV
jgi:hypothetical protein